MIQTANPPVFPYPWATDWGEDQYGLWMGLNHKGVHCVFRWIDPSTFMMGSPENEAGRYEDEDHHQVTITQGFWAAESTVTQALWKSVMEKNPSLFKGENRPVEMVSWDDCHDFIKALNTFHPELEVRLPWEAEWEYACRAGTDMPFDFGMDLTLERVNYRGVLGLALGKDKDKWEKEASKQWAVQARHETTSVRNYLCNAWGLYEMHGNVFEWCQDHWQESLGVESSADPQNKKAEARAMRVARGGAWNSDGWNVRSACRFSSWPDSRQSNLGLRLFLDNSIGSAGGGAA